MTEWLTGSICQPTRREGEVTKGSGNINKKEHTTTILDRTSTVFFPIVVVTYT